MTGPAAATPAPGRVAIVGDRIQAQIAAVRRALLNLDEDYVASLVSRQVACGAAGLDLNLGVYPGFDTGERLAWLVNRVRAVTTLPLWLDSLNITAIERVLAGPSGAFAVNSVSLDPESLDRLLPMVAACDASVVVLAMQQRRLPRNPAAMLDWLQSKALPALERCGIPPGRTYFDLLALPALQKPDAAGVCLEAARLLRSDLDVESHILIAPGNAGYGLPVSAAAALTRVFAVMAVAAGADTLIADPCDRALRIALRLAFTLAPVHDRHDRRRAFYGELVQAARTGRPADLAPFADVQSLRLELTAYSTLFDGRRNR